MKNRILLIFSSVLYQLSSTIGGILITRTYTKIELGTFQQGVYFFSMFATIAAFGAPKAIYYFGKVNSNLKSTLWHILLLIIISNLFFSGILIIFWDNICTLFSNPNLKPLLIYILLVLFFRAINETFQAIAITAEKINFIWQTTILCSFSLVLFISLTCYYHKPLPYLYGSHLIIELIHSGVIIYITLKCKAGKWEGLNSTLIISIIKYSFPLLLSVITLIFSKRIDIFLISSFMNPEAVAIYSRGAIELPIGPIIIYNLASLLTPVFVKCYKEKKFDVIVITLQKEIKRIIVIISPFFYTFLLLSEDFIVFLYTKEYLSSVPIFIVYLFIMPVQIYAFDTILQAMKMTARVFYISIASVVSNIVLSIVLIHIIGMIGAAVGTVVSIFVTNYLCLLVINRQLSNPLKKWLPWTFIIKVNLISLILFSIFYFIVLQLNTIKPIIKIFVIGSSFFMCQIIVFWKINLLVPEDKKLFIDKALTFKKMLLP